MVPWVHLTQFPKRHLDRFIRFCTVHSRACLYFTVGCPLSQNSRFPWGIWTPSITWLLELTVPTQSPQSKQHLDRFSLFCTAYDCERPTDRPTDRLRYSVCNSRPHLRTFVRSSISSYTPTFLLISAHSGHSEYTQAYTL